MRFPQAGIDLLREINVANLPDTCVAVIPGGFVEDGVGGGSYLSDETVTFACRTWPLDARQTEKLVNEQLRQPGLEGLVYSVEETPLPRTATLTITRGESGAVDYYGVVGTVADPTYAMLRRAIIKRAEPPAEPEDEGS